jgi:hypothetical protein
MSNAPYLPSFSAETVPIFLIGADFQPKATILGIEISTSSLLRENGISTNFVVVDNKEFLKEKLRRKWPNILREAREASFACPDPVRSMVRLLTTLSAGNDELWDEIVDEPYG